MVWPAIIAAAGAVGGGLLGGSFNKKEASKQREWAAHMSSTAYQRGMADMRAAGLNPMLAYSQGPASSPSASAARVNDFGGAAAGNIIAQARMRTSQVRQSETQSEVNAASAKNLAKDTELKEQQKRESSARERKTNQETSKTFAERIHTGEKTQLTIGQRRQLNNIMKRMESSGDSVIGRNIDTLKKVIMDIYRNAPSTAKGLLQSLGR